MRKILIIMLILCIFVSCQSNNIRNGSSNGYDNSNNQDRVSEEDMSSERILELDLSINKNVSLTPTFNLKSNLELSIEEIMSGLRVNPMFEFSIFQVNSKEYEIVPLTYLKKNCEYVFTFEGLDLVSKHKTGEIINTYDLLSSIVGKETIINLYTSEGEENYDISILKADNFESFERTYRLFADLKPEEISLSHYKNIYNDTVNPIEGSFLHYVRLPYDLSSGYYLVRLKSKNVDHTVFLQVNKHHIYYGRSVKEEIFFVTDGFTDEISAKIYNENTFIGLTDSDGFYIRSLNEDEQSKYYTLRVDDFEYIFQISDNRSLDAFFKNNYYKGRELKKNKAHNYLSFITTDRVIYKPEDKVSIYAYLGVKDEKVINNVKITMTDFNSGSIMSEKNVELNEYNTVTDEINFSNLEIGLYNISIMVDDDVVDSSYIKVVDPQKPDVIISTSSSEPIVYSGEEVTVKVKVKDIDNIPIEHYEMIYSMRHNDPNAKDLIVTDFNGISMFKITPTLDSSNWRPTNATYFVEGADSEGYPVKSHYNVFIAPRDVMINTSLTKSSETIGLEIRTNNIDLSKFTEATGIDFSALKGDIIERDVHIEVLGLLKVTELQGKDESHLHDIVYDKYRSSIKTLNLGSYNVKTTNGMANLEIPFDENLEYRFIITTKDKMAREVTEEIVTSEVDLGNYDYRDRYTIRRSKDGFKIDEPVSVGIVDFGAAIEKDREDKVLFLLLQNGVVDYFISDYAEQNFTFLESYIPNINIESIYFDSNQMYIVPSHSYESISFDYSDLRVNIDASTNKYNYKIGESVKINLNVTDSEGKPFNGEVNISVVDSLCFSEFDDTYGFEEMLFSNNDSGMIFESISSSSYNFLSKIYGDDYQYIQEDNRDNIPAQHINTVLFDTFEVVNGSFNHKFTLPTSETIWRIKIRAIGADMNIGEENLYIKATN